MAPEHFDAIILGTGQAGKPLALDLGGGRSPDRGRRTGACRRHMHQCRLHTDEDHGRQRRIAYLARRAADYGIRCGPVSVDMGEVHRRKQAIVDDFRSGGSVAWKMPRTSSSFSAKGASPVPTSSR